MADAHGCPGCPHPGTGPAIAGSPDVLVNGRPALRVDDVGVHAACCGGGTWAARRGSATVFINGRAAFRLGDASKHCGCDGQLIEGSADVIVGDQSGGGASGSAAAGSAAAGSAASASAKATSASSTAYPSQQAGNGAAASGKTSAGSPEKLLLRLVNVAGDGLANQSFAITLPGGANEERRSDDSGRARIESTPPGRAGVNWRKARS